MKDSDSTTYVKMNGSYQPLPRNNALAKKIMARITEKQKRLIEKSMTCANLYDCNQCKIGGLCQPEGCEKWEKNNSLELR